MPAGVLSPMWTLELHWNLLQPCLLLGLPGRTLDQFITCHVWGCGLNLSPAPVSTCHLQTQCDCAVLREVMACAGVTLSSCPYPHVEQPQLSYPWHPFSPCSLLKTVASGKAQEVIKRWWSFRVLYIPVSRWGFLQGLS